MSVFINPAKSKNNQQGSSNARQRDPDSGASTLRRRNKKGAAASDGGVTKPVATSEDILSTASSLEETMTEMEHLEEEEECTMATTPQETRVIKRNRYCFCFDFGYINLHH